MPDTQITQWHPPQEKIIHRGVQIIGGLAAIVVGSVLIKMFVPTVADALALVQHLLANTVSLCITAGVLAAVIWLLWETFSPTGKINGLFAQAYSSFIHNMTLELLNVDPMSPLKDSLTQVQAKKAEYDEDFAKFDGAISTFADREQQMRDSAAQAEKRAKAAMSTGDQQTFQRLAYEAGEETKTANDIAAMRQRLVPVRDIIVRMQSYANDLIWKLEVDIKQTQTKWEMANDMTAMDKAARGLLKNNGKSDLAIEAQNIVQTKYAVSIGRLENLSDLAKPLLDGADLDKATYSQDLLAKWQAEDTGSVAVTAQVVQPMPMVTTGSFGALIK
jgi:hypothetical protein